MIANKYFLDVTWVWVDSTSGYWKGHLYTKGRFFRGQTTHDEFEAATVKQAKRHICDLIVNYRNVHVKLAK